MICAILLSALLSPHAAGNSPAYSSLLHPQQYTQKRRKKKKEKPSIRSSLGPNLINGGFLSNLALYPDLFT